MLVVLLLAPIVLLPPTSIIIFPPPIRHHTRLPGLGKTAPAVNSVWELIYPTDEDDFLYETKNVNNSAAATKDFSFTITPMTNMNILCLHNMFHPLNSLLRIFG